MRFAVLGISHETNTFSKVPADYDRFVTRGSVLRGQEIVATFEESNYTIAGYLEACRELGAEAVPLMWAGTGPVGTITKDAYARLSSEMFALPRQQGPWEAVLVANHGAAVAEDHPDLASRQGRLRGGLHRQAPRARGCDQPPGVDARGAPRHPHRPQELEARGDRPRRR